MANDDSHISAFESIRRMSDDGGEYWSARDLAKILSYTQYNKFVNVIQKAETACSNSGQEVEDHFTHMSEMIETGKGARREFETVHLSRYACYLVVQNADPSKEVVALGQTYFAVRTRRDELAAQREEDRHRLEERDKLTQYNRELAEVASEVGVLTQREFATFYDHGYMGLYNGERAKDIAARKGLKRGQHILDYMSSTETAANGLRAAMTAEKLHEEPIEGTAAANRTHFEAGRAVRKAMEDFGIAPPEQQPTPAKSIQDLRREEQKRLAQGPQLSLFPEEDIE